MACTQENTGLACRCLLKGSICAETFYEFADIYEVPTATPSGSLWPI